MPSSANVFKGILPGGVWIRKKRNWTRTNRQETSLSIPFPFLSFQLYFCPYEKYSRAARSSWPRPNEPEWFNSIMWCAVASRKRCNVKRCRAQHAYLHLPIPRHKTIISYLAVCVWSVFLIHCFLFFVFGCCLVVCGFALYSIFRLVSVFLRLAFVFAFAGCVYNAYNIYARGPGIFRIVLCVSMEEGSCVRSTHRYRQTLSLCVHANTQHTRTANDWLLAPPTNYLWALLLYHFARACVHIFSLFMVHVWAVLWPLASTV